LAASDNRSACWRSCDDRLISNSPLRSIVFLFLHP
jgi:hypothetical protein